MLVLADPHFGKYSWRRTAGADYDLDAKSGVYRFKKVYRERDWNSSTAAPLGERAHWEWMFT